MAEDSTRWFLIIRTADEEHSYCCMTKQTAMETLIDEVARFHGEVIEAELRHPNGEIETLPLV